MKEKPVFPLIMSMALPMVISMLVNSLYNIVDSYFVAKISEDAMTALSLVYPVQNFINAVAIGFGVGINALIAFYLGAENNEAANASATRGTVLSVIHGVLMTVGCIAFMPHFLRFFTPDVSVINLGLRYSNIVFAFSVIITLNLSFEKIFQALGKMKVTMIALMCGCLTNIFLDPVMIFGLGPFPEMGIEGAALATGIGQVVNLVIYLAVYRLRPIHVRIKKDYLKPDKGIDLRLYSIGIPAALNLALPSLLISVLNSLLAAFSQSYVVILGIYYKLQTFLYLPASGIVQGMRPVIGYNYGAQEYRRVRRIYLVTLAMSSVIMIAGTAICLSVPERLMEMFTFQSGNCPGRRNRTAHYQRRIPGIRRIRHFLRRAGGTWKGNRFSGDLPVSLCTHYSSGRVYTEPHSRRFRSMARLLDRGGGYRCRVLHDQQEEGLSVIFPGILQSRNAYAIMPIG